jgi:EmrB/QacA subfamily drug resistance transporter
VSASDDAWPAADARRWLVLAVVLIGACMAILDVAIVNVAIPSIRSDLHAGFGAVELVISAYTLTYACLLVTGGRLGDLYGRKRLFVIGILGFAAASALCGAAPSIGVLIVARAIQGVAGALMYPQVLAVIQVSFAGAERTKALGLFGATLGLASIAGQIIGGLLLAANVFGLTWRPVFLVNVPLGLIAALAAVRLLPADHRDENSRLDLGGVGLITVSLLLLAVPLLTGRDAGWPPWMIICLVAAVPAAAGFIFYERRLAARGGRPLVRLELFRNRGFATGVPIALLFMFSYAGFLLILAVYLQSGLGFSPLRSGLTYTPDAVAFFLASLAAPKLVPILGRHVLSAGYVIAALGLLGTAATAAAAGGHLNGLELAPTLFIAGLGQGLGLSPMIGTIISGVDPRDAGSASGVVTTTMQIGNVLGVALSGLLFFTLLGSGHTGAASATAFGRALPLSAAILLVAAVFVHRLPRTPFEAENALIERLPGWAAGYAYSMFLMTGGRIGDSLFHDILGHVTERRLRRVQEAPLPPGEFLVHHFRAEGEDSAWLAYLQREALAYGAGPIPHEADRLPIIQIQVDEVRRRQEAGLVTTELEPDLLRMLGFAIVTYPRLLPQITRMVTGTAPDDPAFAARWENFLRQVGERLQPDHDSAGQNRIVG